MALYSYKGLDAKGKPVSGTRESDGAKGLRAALRKDGVFLTDVREAARGERKGGAAGSGASSGGGLKREVDLRRLFERVSSQQVAVITRQLATLLRAGIPLAEALSALTGQSENKKLEMVLASIRQRVNEGGALADAMKQYPDVFGELYTNMVRSGEAAGNLDAVLSRLADFLDAQNVLRSKVSGALTYPVIMMIVGAGVMGFLMVVVIPQITEIFSDVGKALPWNTQLLIFTAGFVGSFWWAIIIVGVAAVVGFRRWARSPKGRRVVDRLWLRLKLIGPLIRHVAVARFARTLSTMLAAGVPMLTALEITKKVLNNVILEKVIEEARDAVREGDSLAAPLKRSGQFPSMMCHMVAVGERSGQLEAMLENVATAYEREVDTSVARLTTALSPIMILALAIGVGFIIVSILGPILDMQQFVN